MSADPARRPTAAEIVQLLMQLPPSHRPPPPPSPLLPQGSGPITPPRISAADEPAPETPGPLRLSAPSSIQWGSPERPGPAGAGSAVAAAAGQYAAAAAAGHYAAAGGGGGSGGALGRASSLPPLGPSGSKPLHLDGGGSSRLTAAGSFPSEWSGALSAFSRAATL